ncbi:MAG: glutamate synthase large subunit [Acidimicrobiia bacterium]|nr:glutamate synthase large subunit [Acidimicrobiia bacterium]
MVGSANRRTRHLTRMPLYDPRYEHDACGVGFIASRDGRASFRMTRLTVECLQRLDHRGARAADGTGDGAGVMTQIPLRLIERHLAANGLSPSGRLGVVMTFLPPDDPEAGRKVISDALGEESIELLSWRVVPVDPGVLSPHAAETMPRIEQAIVTADLDEEEFERRLFVARKGMEAGGAGLDRFSIPSTSCRTVVYKGLFPAESVAGFYWDLTDPDFETAFGIFHQRYSTNTFPAWAIAQPFRTLAHNGEINTIAANRSWMLGREMAASNPKIRHSVWGSRVGDLVPFLEDSQSDSGSLDNIFELLVRSGRGLAHTKEFLLPEAWENVSDLDPVRRSFYEYHAFLMEPWDGPAAIAATDGKDLLAGLDRNGLRPARWTITPNVVLVASEAGVCPEEEAQAERTGQLGPGEVLLFDRTELRVQFSEEVKSRLARQAPYGEWINSETFYVQQPFDRLADDRFDPAAMSRVFGYTAEERRVILAEMAEGKSPLGSMGSDTAVATLSSRPRRVSHYLHQLFAQVTNPPMDPIREQSVMSLRTYMGGQAFVLDETPNVASVMELDSPILSDAELEAIVRSSDSRFFSHWIAAVWPRRDGPEGMRARISEILEEAEAAVRAGARFIVLSDRELDAEHAPIPPWIICGAVHHRFTDLGMRARASVISVTGDVRDSHDLAMLLACGVTAVNPYLAIDQARTLAAEDVVSVDPVMAQENYRSALKSGLLKVLSKMGICTVSAYRASGLFEVVGLDDEVRNLAFRNAAARTSGLGLDEIAAGVLQLHQRFDEGEEDPGGFYKQRRGGDLHVTSPAVVLAVQRAVRSGEQKDWEAYLEKIEDRPPTQLRDKLRFVERRPIPVSDVEDASHIMRRFVTAAMSLGALSPETHEALSEAMNHIGALSNSGEGGEADLRFGTSRNSAIKQVASGRFGVTPTYLASGEEYQIKMAQGSKPGEGGQLPGHKVTSEIAQLRHTEPGTGLISPPPHHDIYSIEDLAQLIYDLKSFKPTARVSVKLVSEPGVGTVAVGVAKAQADGILISGSDGGTGASPLESIKHAGSPWELGLAEAHQVLVANGLRSGVALETDGGIRTGRDVVIAALLGAERFGFGTLPLLALGCKMVRQCHLNTCPVGIATQREDLRAKFTGAAEQVVALFRMLAEEVRTHLASLGVRSLGEVIGRADLLEPADDSALAQGLSQVLVRAEGRLRHPGFRRFEQSTLTNRLFADAIGAIENRESLTLAYPISNVDRAIGARLSGEIAARWGTEGMAPETISIRLSGVAGQSFGAWLSPGLDLSLAGPANDYVGKGMGGGRIVITPRPGEGIHRPHAAGNAVLYGATGGTVFIAGTVGQRFAVRNSGATVVIEGCSDHGCEYMTGGTAVILGRVGRNFGAGMTGGAAYVWDPEMTLRHAAATTAPSMERPNPEELARLRELVEGHLEHTSSPVAAKVLSDWDVESNRFWILHAFASGRKRSQPVSLNR